MRVSSIRRARWRRGRVTSGAEGRRRPRFTAGEACWPGGAGWKRVESRAGQCSHALRETCRRSEQVAKRWRPRNARGPREGAGARGAGARPERAQLGPSEPRGAQSWERPAGGPEPLSYPSPAAPGAAPSSAEPHPGALAPPRCPGTGGESARSRPVPPARDSSADQPAQVLRACGPPGGSHDPRRAAAAESRGTRGRPGRRGRSARKRPRSRGGEPGRPASSAGRSRASGQCLTGALSPPGGLGKSGGNPPPPSFPGRS